MSDVGAAVKARLEATTPVTNLVGVGPNARIFPMRLPQKPTLEAITYRKIGMPTRVHAFGQDPGLMEARVSVSSWAPTYDRVKILGEAVRDGLSRASGTFGGVVVQGMLFDNELDLYEDDTELYRVNQDYLIWHEA